MSMIGGDEVALHATLEDDASPELRNIRGELQGVGRQAETTGRQASRSAKGFGTLHKAGKVAALGLKAAFGAALVGGYAAVKLLTSSFAEAREAQKVGAITSQTIKTMGNRANVSAKQVGRLSTAISLKTGVDDEAIQSGANLLLTFGNIRNEVGKGSKIFNRATKAALDLSAHGFGDMAGTSKQLGKALNDPVKGITALSKSGVTFTAQQQEQIKALTASGDLLGAQKIILGEVERQVKGTAQAQATWGDKAAVAWGNAEEALGTALLPTLDRLEKWFVKKGVPLLDKWVGIFQDKGIPAIGRFLRKAQPLAEQVLPAVGDALGTIRDVMDDLAPKITSVFRGFNGLPKWAKSALVIGAGGAAVASKLGVFSAAKTVAGKIASKAAPLPVFVTNPGFGAGSGSGSGSAPRPGGTQSTAERSASSAAGGAAASRAATLKKYARNTGILTVGAGAVYLGADAVASYLGSRKADSSASDKAAYSSSLGKYGKDLNKVSPITISINPATGQPLVTANQFFDPKAGAALSTNVTRPLSVATTTARELGTTLGDVARTKVDPKVTPIGFPPAQRDADTLKASLVGIGGAPFTARVNLDATAAWNELARLRAAGQFVGPVSSTAPTTTGKTKTPRAYGGRVVAGRSYLVGERRAEEFTPDRSGWIKPRATAESRSGGGVTMAEGAVQVRVDNPGSNVDVADAVQQGIEAWFRDREERA